MTAKKGCLLLGLGGLLLAIAIVALVFWLTGGAVKSTEHFLALLGKGETEAAYSSTSAQFKEQTDLATFQGFVGQLGLDRYASASWTSRKVENDQAALEGSITTTDGGTVPLTVSLVREDGDWKILSISGPQAGVATTGSPKPLPSDSELTSLAGRTLVDFKSAVESADFTAFHGQISNLWKNQTTPEGLQSAFQSVIDAGADLGGATGEPTFSEAPSMDGDGVLHLKGYATAPGSPNLEFELKYVYEHPNWKLVGIRVFVPQTEGGQ